MTKDFITDEELKILGLNVCQEYCKHNCWHYGEYCKKCVYYKEIQKGDKNEVDN